MRKILLVVILLGMMMAVGLVLTGCGGKCSTDGNCEVGPGVVPETCGILTKDCAARKAGEGSTKVVKCDCN
ncbi:MAG: hypothetical protein FWB95_08400 [Treponema sp.]|nr:hypothetical protein [Treponema sp.]